MDYEISKFGPNSRTSVTNKLKKYKLDIEIIQRDLVSVTGLIGRLGRGDSLNVLLSQPEKGDNFQRQS